ncbi:nascent polypeptide-associated complex subunit alpha, muscle-specific form-like [Pseudopipra pipra]|uniref:nascent polypeptide-associated complex subunit alpha, muscle-specific form-like n=1 Tax=Pseudopipra pipra TaxID=415032 RepID=UPI0031391D96
MPGLRRSRPAPGRGCGGTARAGGSAGPGRDPSEGAHGDLGVLTASLRGRGSARPARPAGGAGMGVRDGGAPRSAASLGRGPGGVSPARACHGPAPRPGPDTPRQIPGEPRGCPGSPQPARTPLALSLVSPRSRRGDVTSATTPRHPGAGIPLTPSPPRPGAGSCSPHPISPRNREFRSPPSCPIQGAGFPSPPTHLIQVSHLPSLHLIQGQDSPHPHPTSSRNRESRSLPSYLIQEQRPPSPTSHLIQEQRPPSPTSHLVQGQESCSPHFPQSETLAFPGSSPLRRVFPISGSRRALLSCHTFQRRGHFKPIPTQPSLRPGDLGAALTGSRAG